MFGVRIKEERQLLGLSQELLADKLGISRRTMVGWEKDDSSPTTVQLFALHELGFDVNYIITGQKVNRDEPIIDEFAKIPVYDVEASAGHGSFFNGENVLYHMAYRKEWIRNRGLNVKDLGIIVIKGDSMEPTLSDRESILINQAETEPKDGHIYVVRSDDVLWVKRVQRLPNHQVLLISDNKFYPPITIDLKADDFQVIGKVVNSSRNFY